MCVACFGSAGVGCKSELSDTAGHCSMRILRARCLLQERLALAAAVERMSCSCAESCVQMNLVATWSKVSCDAGGQLSV